MLSLEENVLLTSELSQLFLDLYQKDGNCLKIWLVNTNGSLVVSEERSTLLWGLMSNREKSWS